MGRRLRSIALPAMLLATGGCGAGGDATDGIDPWLAPYAAAAAAEDGGWPALDVEVSVATFRQDGRLREYVPSCTSRPTEVRPDSIGPLRVGQTLSELTTACPRVLRGWDWGAGGTAIPAAAVSVGGSIVVALFADTIAEAVVGQLATGELSTPEGFGAGSPIEDLIDSLGAPELIGIECGVELKFASRPGLSFPVELPPGAQLDCQDFEAAVQENSADRLPPGTMVSAIIVFPQG